MKKLFSSYVLTVLGLAVLLVYLFVNAPPPLPDQTQARGKLVSVETLFKIVAAESATIRSLYTSEIVGPGLKAGLKFNEDWKEKNSHAGPLPALLLREISNRLQRNGLGLNLFLGSDYPIVAVNQFSGVQAPYFQKIKIDGEPQFFLDPDTRLQTAMFIDPASAPACVKCHNEHPNSPKKDWKLNDPMGATTWLYPKQQLTQDELLIVLAAFRLSVKESYEVYIAKAEGFTESSPTIGEKWPRDGLFIPSTQTFMKTATQAVSAKTVDQLLAATEIERVAKN
jgi:adenylate cyclase